MIGRLVIGTLGDGTFCMGTLNMAIELFVGPHGLFRIRIPVHFNTDPDLSSLMWIRIQGEDYFKHISIKFFTYITGKSR